MSTETLSDGLVHKRSRGHLPHWQRDGATYFVTFRLNDSLPQHVLSEIIRHKGMIQTARLSDRPLLSIEKQLEGQLSTKRVEEYLDSGQGRCELARPCVAQIVLDALKYWDGTRYDLVAWCLMPNHVHIVFRAFAGERLDSIVKSWKSFSGRKVNAMLGKGGSFWQREYYDRLIRNEQELGRAIEYVLNNPVRAGLISWKWVGEKLAGLESGATSAS